MSDLAQTLAAHPRFRWVAGICIDSPQGCDWIRGVDADGCPNVFDYACVDPERLRRGVCADIDDPAPEELADEGDDHIKLDDPATGGVLFGLLVEACGRHRRILLALNPERSTGDAVEVVVRSWKGVLVASGRGAALGEACAKALLSVWSTHDAR